MKKKINKIKLQLKIKKFFKEQLGQYIFVIAFVVFCAWLFSKPWEAVMFCAAHLVIRPHFDKQFHCGTTAICMMTTLTISFFGIATVLPVAVSLLSALPVCCFICWVGYLAQDRADLIQYQKEKEVFNLDTCTKEQIVERCKLLRYKKEKIELAVMFFVEKKSLNEVWEFLCANQRNVEYDTIYKQKQRIKKDLLKFTKK